MKNMSKFFYVFILLLSCFFSYIFGYRFGFRDGQWMNVISRASISVLEHNLLKKGNVEPAIGFNEISIDDAIFSLQSIKNSYSFYVYFYKDFSESEKEYDKKLYYFKKEYPGKKYPCKTEDNAFNEKFSENIKYCENKIKVIEGFMNEQKEKFH